MKTLLFKNGDVVQPNVNELPSTNGRSKIKRGKRYVVEHTFEEGGELFANLSGALGGFPIDQLELVENKPS